MKIRILLFLLLLLLVSGCFSEKKPVTESWGIMGTVAGFSVPAKDSKHLSSYSSIAKSTFTELDQSLSTFKPESEISRLNNDAGVRPVSLSKHVLEVLNMAVKYAKLSDGAFDPTVAPLVQLWGFNGGTLPVKPLGDATISSVMELVGCEHLSISNNVSYLDSAGMKVDLGGIAKGYAVDVLYQKLDEMNAKNIMIDLGGNIRCKGLARGKKPWKIGVRNPIVTDQIIGTIELTDGIAVATSGNYERCVKIAGKTYAHIIDPRTGRPVEGMAGVTVVSDSAAKSDAMSTALFVLGLDRAKAVLKTIPNCEALFVPAEEPLRILITPGFARNFVALPAFAGRIEIIK